MDFFIAYLNLGKQHEIVLFLFHPQKFLFKFLHAKNRLGKFSQTIFFGSLSTVVGR